MNILLVEDEPSCRTATAMLLEHLGCSVDTAASGEEALACFSPSRHEIVITDLLMPGMSGEQLAVAIKRRSPTTPIVAYTGTAVTEPPGTDAVLTKPASIDDFRKTLSGVCSLALSNEDKPRRVDQGPGRSDPGSASSTTRPRSLRCRQSLRGTPSRDRTD